MIKKPEFKTGNASIRKALNEVAEYARRHGVNPAGLPGWSETIDGWNPPIIGPGSESSPEHWGLRIISETGVATKVAIKNPGTVKKTTAYDNSGLVTITGIADEFTPAAGKLLVIKVAPDLAASLEMVDEWTGWPYPIQTAASSPPGYRVLSYYYYLLYAFVPTADSTDPFAVSIGDSLKAEKRGFNNNLQFVLSRGQDSTGAVVSYFELLPAVGCERS